MKKSTEGIYEVIHTFKSNELRQLSVIPGDKVGVCTNRACDMYVCTHCKNVRTYVRTLMCT